MGETAVIVNELGEVGIDHHLLRRVDERTVVLAERLRLLHPPRRPRRRAARPGRAPGPRRDPVVPARRRRDDRPRRPGADRLARCSPTRSSSTTTGLDAVVTTVDAQHGPAAHHESVRQVAVADRLVLTKADVAEPAAVTARLRRAQPGRADPGGGLRRRRARGAVRRGDERDPRDLVYDRLAGARPTTCERSPCTFDEPLDWTAFGIWLAMLLQARGEDVLRVKGLLDVGAPGPGRAQRRRARRAPARAPARRGRTTTASRLVLIVRGLEREALQRSLDAFNRA